MGHRAYRRKEGLIRSLLATSCIALVFSLGIFAASPLLFLSHDTPIELLKLGGDVTVARERMPATRFW